MGAIVPICVEHRPISATHGAGKEETLVLPPAVERACQMFTAEQYRAKAAEFRALLTNTPRSPNETKEFRDLEQTYTRLAENEEWMAVNLDKTIQRREDYDNSAPLVEEEEQILKFLGAAVLCAGIPFPRSSNGSSSTALVPSSAICSRQRRSRDR
jgi:hypothetical protein